MKLGHAKPPWKPSEQLERAVDDAIAAARTTAQQWARDRAREIKASSSPMSGRYEGADGIAANESGGAFAKDLGRRLLELVNQDPRLADAAPAEYLKNRLISAASPGWAAEAASLLGGEISRIAARPKPPIGTQLKDWMRAKPWFAIPTLIVSALVAALGTVATILTSLNAILDQTGNLCERVEGTESLLARLCGLVF